MNKYGAVLADLEQKIEDGRFRPGQKLPSVRAAAQIYQCSAGTVVRAYAELEKRHVIYSVSQSGHYVVDRPVKQSGDTGNKTIDFSSPSPDSNVFPYLDFQHCLNQAIDIYKHQLFTYGDSRGLDKLRHTLVSHLADDQVFAKAERILITSGVQQALEILAKMPFPNGKAGILVEQPSYDIYLRYLEWEGLPVYGIARSGSGIDLQELEERFRSGAVKFFYTMSRTHNPLGTTYDTETRKAIAGLAGKYDVYVVEDDYMADLGEERGFEPIFAFCRTPHAIYLKSFSKIIFPGLRLGAAVLPEQLLDTFLRYKRYADTSLLSQAALDVYIKNGMYERHKRKIGFQYQERLRIWNEAVKPYRDAGLFEAAQITSGVYVPLKLQRTVNLERLTSRLLERNVIVTPGKPFYLSGYRDKEKFLRISISRAQPEQIMKGVAVLVEEVRREHLEP